MEDGAGDIRSMKLWNMLQCNSVIHSVGTAEYRSAVGIVTELVAACCEKHGALSCSFHIEQWRLSFVSCSKPLLVPDFEFVFPCGKAN